MSAGTLTLANKSAAVFGSGTAFATELAAGDFIVVTVGGIPYTLPVKTVNSNTSLTLVSNFTGPTQSGAAWSAVSRLALNMVTAALVAQSAEALRGLNYDKQNWQQVFSSPGMITVRLPDGSSFPGPSWKYLSDNMATKENGAVPINQGGTGANTDAGARTKLGLGSSSTRDTGSAEGQVVVAGQQGSPTDAYGYFATTTGNTVTISNWNNITSPGLYQGVINPGAGNNSPAPGVYSYCRVIKRSNEALQQYALPYATPTSAGRMFTRGLNGTTWSPWAEFYTTENTTKSSDGTLKAASPVVRIVKSREVCQRSDIDETGFQWCGCGTANAEAEGVTISRLDVGVYVLTGAVGLASEGWQLLPPMDPGGMGELGVVEAEQTESGGLVIRLFKRKYMLSDGGEIVKTKGEPIDVPENSWIDVRMDMPEDSAWNRKQAEANNGSDMPEGAGI